MCEHVCRTVNDHIAIKITPFRSMELALANSVVEMKPRP